MAKVAQRRGRKAKPLRSAASSRAHELARSVRKPIAPPARVEEAANRYERRRGKHAIDESMEESR
jgi:hypothetical protein